MNWLIYVGGWLIAEELLMGLCEYFNREKYNVVQVLIWTFNWTLVWIWICWRFIR